MKRILPLIIINFNTIISACTIGAAYDDNRPYLFKIRDRGNYNAAEIFKEFSNFLFEESGIFVNE